MITELGVPREPAPSRWALTGRRGVPGQDVVAVGGDLEPGTVLTAYRNGLFPMGIGDVPDTAMGWWSPERRGVLGPGDLHVSRSLQRALRRFDVRVDTAFDDVLAGCADPSRPGWWITDRIAAAYRRLHELGWAHSIDVYQDGELAGGLYGVSVGGLFAGESMFHRRRDASKGAVVGLVRHLEAASAQCAGAESGEWLIDVQWQTPHLATLGVREVSRVAYLAALPDLATAPHRWPGAHVYPGHPSALEDTARGNIS